ncbi:MAG: MerR family transcriptional regulator [bacterium]|nr:MerR family transcriptional regulator [bacterium]
MSTYTVKQVARLSGVSVRALHHYDALGLLRPSSVGANGYRYYSQADLQRLQQVLFYRELETPLRDIQAALDDPGFDAAAALRHHRVRLAAEAQRYDRLVRVIDQTLETLNGDETMSDKQMFQGFSPEKQAAHEAWLIENYGGDMPERIAESKAGMRCWTKTDGEDFQAEARGIETDLAAALSQGAPVESGMVTAIMRRHWDWVGRAWNRAPDPGAFAGLGRLYLEVPEFTERYEAVAPGLTEYLAEAMRAFAAGKG